MRFLFISILLLNYVYADLQSKITSNAQTACYIKNISSGLQATDYAPVVSSQSLRQTIESTHSSNSAAASCASWESDPYVNVDYETYNVIATMTCTSHQETVDIGGGTMATYYWTVEEQYDLVINCQASCEVPRDIDGNIYDFTPYINETDCTVTNLQQLLLAEDPNSLYTIVDTQYLNCTENNNLTGCFYKKTISFDGGTDSNSTDNNSTDNNTTADNNSTLGNADLTATNEKLDAIGTKLDTNGQKIDALGTKIDSNGLKIDNLGIKIDANGVRINAVSDSVISTGNYLGAKLDNMNDSITNELKFQGDRLHDDLNDLKALQSQPTDTNGSSGFDDSGIIEAIHQNTDAINEIKDLNNGELDADASFLDTYQTYYDDMSQSIQDVENNVNDLMATIQGDYTPQFQSYNSCIVTFSFYNRPKSVDMCKFSPILRPFLTFILTIAMLILLIRLHFYLFPKVYKSD